MCVCVRERGGGVRVGGKLELSTVIKPPGREGKETTELREGLSTHSPAFAS